MPPGAFANRRRSESYTFGRIDRVVSNEAARVHVRHGHYRDSQLVIRSSTTILYAAFTAFTRLSVVQRKFFKKPRYDRSTPATRTRRVITDLRGLLDGHVVSQTRVSYKYYFSRSFARIVSNNYIIVVRTAKITKLNNPLERRLIYMIHDTRTCSAGIVICSRTDRR